MKKRWFLFCFFIAYLLSPPTGESLALKDRLCSAEVGSYIVTEHSQHYSLLTIRSKDTDTLLLEEVSGPIDQIDLTKYSWQTWLQAKAPGHTSWTFYQIDLKSNTLVECYSLTKKSWLALDEDQFLSKLFTLPLHPISQNARKRIGPPPPAGEVDRRALWIPPLVVEGKKVNKPSITAYETRWPNDNSRLSASPLELYFSDSVPFPIWIEVKSPHYTFKIHVVDAGHHCTSPLSFKMPLRPPQFVGAAVRSDNMVRLEVKCPVYFEKLNLFALDLDASQAALPIPFHLRQGKEKELLSLEIDQADLHRLFQNSHRYRWILIPENAADVYVESDPLFVWKPCM